VTIGAGTMTVPRNRRNNAVQASWCRSLVLSIAQGGIASVCSGRTGDWKGQRHPMGRGYWKPCESALPQVRLVTGYAGASALTAKIFTIFEGTSEIQRMIIGRAVTGLDVR
jgi:alkylation response protein AidB-like acyl-CoA dehydrogenase